MSGHSKMAIVSVVLLLVLSLPAFADSNGSFSNEKLIGSSGSTLSGSFTFTGNASGGTFSNLSLSFNGGAFGGVSASDAKGGKATCAFGLCSFSWKAKAANGDWVWDKIVLNVKTGQYQDFGRINNWQNRWKFDPPVPVPEGGTPLSYLMLSGLAVSFGILMSGKQRRTTRSADSA
jgi:hypothetical protein